jgi:hypothetical protein
MNVIDPNLSFVLRENARREGKERCRTNEFAARKHVKA